MLVKGDLTSVNTLAVLCFGGSLLCFMSAVVLEWLRGYQTQLSGREEGATGWLFQILFMGEPGLLLFKSGVIGLLLGAVLVFRMNFCELAVTNRRMYGKSAFGRQIDLPLDQILSVKTGFLKGIFVTTSSGAVKFWLLRNQREVYEAVSALLQGRPSSEE